MFHAWHNTQSKSPVCAGWLAQAQAQAMVVVVINGKKRSKKWNKLHIFGKICVLSFTLFPFILLHLLLLLFFNLLHLLFLLVVLLLILVLQRRSFSSSYLYCWFMCYRFWTSCDAIYIMIRGFFYCAAIYDALINQSYDYQS